MRRMPMTDAMFLINESRETPMHVGGLALYTLPENEDEEDYLRGLLELMRQDVGLRRPLGDVLQMTPLGTAGPIYLKADKNIDYDYHVRHSALPKPGRYRELFSLVSRLHSTLLDRSRPLWEFTIISGLQGRQFAVYSKYHHSILDGASGTHLANSIHSPDPDARITLSPFSQEVFEIYKAKNSMLASEKPKRRDVLAVGKVIGEQLGGVVGIGKAMLESGQVWVGRKSDLSVPFKDIPRTSLNGSVSGARRVVAQSWEFARIRNVGKAFDGTFNDAVLAMCSGALRKYLLTHDELPAKSLKSMVPVSLRDANDVDSANAVGAIVVNLATNITDPKQRFLDIQKSVVAAKAQLKGLNTEQVVLYNTLMQSPMLLANAIGRAEILPPFNTVISNVPGTRGAVYLNGAKLDGSYPASIPMDGVALNITLVTTNKNADFGITACRKSVPHAQRLIDYLDDALVELEIAAGLATKPKTKSKAKKASAKKTTAKKTKTKAKTKTTASTAKAATRKSSAAKATAKTPKTRKAAPKKPAVRKASAKPTAAASKAKKAPAKRKPAAKAKPKTNARARS